MFPPALYTHVIKTLKKHLILVLNKIDLVAPESVVAWQHYFKDLYPEMPVVHFATHAKPKNKGKCPIGELLKIDVFISKC